MESSDSSREVTKGQACGDGSVGEELAWGTSVRTDTEVYTPCKSYAAWWPLIPVLRKQTRDSGTIPPARVAQVVSKGKTSKANVIQEILCGPVVLQPG